MHWQLLTCAQPELAGGKHLRKNCQCHDLPWGNREVMTLPFSARTGSDQVNLLPGGAYWWHWIKGGCVGFWKNGEVGLPANPMLCQKKADSEPAQKKNFCVLCLKLANFFMSAPPILINTLLLHIPLLALTDRQTEWQNDRQRNKYTRCAWAGGTFFPVVLLCQFLILAGNRFWCYILTYLEYNTVVALCWFFGSGGK